MDHATYMSRPIPVGSTAWQIVQKTRVDAMEEGLAKGKAEGKAKGKAEGQAESTAQIAIRLLSEGLGDEMIRRVTKLDQSDIDDLRKRL